MAKIRHYGIVYTGSKSKIAKSIVGALPSGTRLVDLFGGGCAITDCAISEYGHKYKKFVYNDYDSVLVEFIKRCVHRQLPKQPEFIDRETFKKLKDVDGYIRYCWSFGCRGLTYFCNEESEKIKKSMHNWVVFNNKDDYIKTRFAGYDLVEKDRESRRLEAKTIVNKVIKEQGEKNNHVLQELQVLIHMENLGRLEHMECLESLHKLENLGRLDFTNISYEDYEYQEGDIVYCDIPYENTATYAKNEQTGGFDQDKFFKWAMSRPYPVYISSLFGWSHAKDLYIVWGKDINSTFAQKNPSNQSEVLFCTKPPKEKYGYHKQINLFEDIEDE